MERLVLIGGDAVNRVEIFTDFTYLTDQEADAATR
jgi:hypothetical protein